MDPKTLTDNLEVIDCVVLMHNRSMDVYELAFRIVWGGTRWRLQQLKHYRTDSPKEAVRWGKTLAKNVGVEFKSGDDKI